MKSATLCSSGFGSCWGIVALRWLRGRDGVEGMFARVEFGGEAIKHVRMAYHASEMEVRAVGFGSQANGSVVGEKVECDCAGQGVRCRQRRGHGAGFSMIISWVDAGWCRGSVGM